MKKEFRDGHRKFIAAIERMELPAAGEKIEGGIGADGGFRFCHDIFGG